MIQEAWGAEYIGSLMFKVASKIKKCRMALLTWNKHHTSNSALRIIQLKKRFGSLERQARSTGLETMV